MLLLYQQVRFQLCLISYLFMLVLIHKIGVFCMSDFQYLIIRQFYMAFYTHNHTYEDAKYNHHYNKIKRLILYIHTDTHHDSIFALNYVHFH